MLYYACYEINTKAAYFRGQLRPCPKGAGPSASQFLEFPPTYAYIVDVERLNSGTVSFNNASAVTAITAPNIVHLQRTAPRGALPSYTMLKPSFIFFLIEYLTIFYISQLFR